MTEATVFAVYAVLAVGLWALFCNQRTFKQRRKIMPKSGHPDFWAWAALLEKATYEQHLWALLTFRNPWRLYGLKSEPVHDLPGGNKG